MINKDVPTWIASEPQRSHLSSCPDPWLCTAVPRTKWMPRCLTEPSCARNTKLANHSLRTSTHVPESQVFTQLFCKQNKEVNQSVFIIKFYLWTPIGLREAPLIVGPWSRATKKHWEDSLPSWEGAVEDASADILYPSIHPSIHIHPFFQPVNIS